MTEKTLFSEPQRPPARARALNFRLTEAERQRLEVEAQQRGLTLSQLARQALGQYVATGGERCER